ncbi:MMPL family transporter [Clostridiaceae bacterium OttesenSCG-928-D20]|nr:MMPL family transporter [Clostridiaceae bacterium OttesenSCG-928-D20]
MARFIIKHRKLIVILFIAGALLGGVLSLGVKVNYDMVDYLPESAGSTKAISVMNEEFSQSIPNTNVMVKNVSITEALEYKAQIAELVGVTEILWLDDMADVTIPINALDKSTVETFYKEGDALFQVTLASGLESDGVNAIRGLLGERGAVSGEAPDKSFMEGAAVNEVLQATIILVPLVVVFLMFATSSWIEPLLFLIAIGVSILFNMGTNILFGEISFVTNSVSPILQLAVSLDYAIFLLHSFADYRKKYGDVERAMRHAMKKSVRAVAASAVTTLFGFIALTFMDMGIGKDLGLNLAKGIVFSFISCMVFLPALTVMSVKLLDKCSHRPLLPSTKNVYKGMRKISYVALFLAIVLIVPAFLGQLNTPFTYGVSDTNETGSSHLEAAAIDERFGKSSIIAILVPRGDVARELSLSEELDDLDHVTGVMSYASTVGTEIPADMLGSDVTDNFYSENYARLILYTDTKSEGDTAFALVEKVEETVKSHYEDGYYMAGESVNLYDMKNVIKVDNVKTNLIAIISIFLVLIITFKSVTLPIFLLLTIEIGIWINLSIPYFANSPINFLGYLVINTVQLGATVDYAILLTSYYMDSRKKMPQNEAMHFAMGQTFKSIILSGASLAIAGFALSITSSNPIVSILGTLLFRGTILSVIMVLGLLPALLRLFDKPTGKLTFGANFFRERTENNE